MVKNFEATKWPYYIQIHVIMRCVTKGRQSITITVKAPNIGHLSILTSIGYNKKETNLKKMFTAK